MRCRMGRGDYDGTYGPSTRSRALPSREEMESGHGKICSADVGRIGFCDLMISSSADGDGKQYKYPARRSYYAGFMKSP